MKKIIITGLFFISILNAGGSRFGLIDKTLGNVVLPYSAAGIGRSYEIAHNDSLQLNFQNYAVWNNISKTTLSLNLNYDAIFAKNAIENSYSDNASFDGAFIAVPLVQKKMVLGVGLHPFTSINQRIFLPSSLDSVAVNTNTLIKGGLSKATLTFVYRIDHRLSMALGYEYTFGKINETSIISLSNNLNSVINYQYDSRLSANGIVLSTFYSPISALNLGLIIRPTVNGTITKVGKTVSSAINNDVEQNISLPTEISIGAEYRFPKNYLVGMDFIYQDWTHGFEVEGKTINQYNTYYHLGIGVEKQGSERRFVNYLEQIDLRAGVFYNNLAQLYNNKAVIEAGFSLGISFPIVRFRSKVDFAGFVSKRGDVSKNTLEETTVGIKFSISANEVWFVNLED